MSIVYRKPTMQDIRDIAEIYIDDMNKDPYNKKLSFPLLEKEITHDIQHADVFFVAVNTDLEKVIWIIIWNIFTRLWKKRIVIKSLFILSKYQRKGIGTTLLQKVIVLWKQEGIYKIELIAHQDWDAMKFYDKNNLKVTEMRHLEIKL